MFHDRTGEEEAPVFVQSTTGSRDHFDELLDGAGHADVLE
jgi:hypothetical protein